MATNHLCEPHGKDFDDALVLHRCAELVPTILRGTTAISKTLQAKYGSFHLEAGLWLKKWILLLC